MYRGDTILHGVQKYQVAQEVESLASIQCFSYNSSNIFMIEFNFHLNELIEFKVFRIVVKIRSEIV